MSREHLVFVNLSTATGLVIGPGIPSFTFDGYVVAAVGDDIEPHGPYPHDSATLVVPSDKYSVGGVQAAMSGVPASCGCIVSTPLKYG